MCLGLSPAGLYESTIFMTIYIQHAIMIDDQYRLQPDMMFILDPLKVTRYALQNAASVAMMVLTTEGLVADLPEEKTPAMGGMPPGGMGGMDY